MTSRRRWLARGLWASGALMLGSGRRASALSVRMNEAELMARCDLVALGRWTGQTELGVAGDAHRLHVGAVAVSEVLKGPAGATLALVVTGVVGRPRASTDPVFRVGDQGAWCLRLRPGGSGLYLADHAQSLLRLPDEAAAVEALRRAAGGR